jgi:hypothetical protein
MGRTRTSAALLAAAAQAPAATRAAHAAAAPTVTAPVARGMRPHSALRDSLPASPWSGHTSVRRSWSLPMAGCTKSTPPQTSCGRRADRWWVFPAEGPAWLLLRRCSHLHTMLAGRWGASTPQARCAATCLPPFSGLQLLCHDLVGEASACWQATRSLYISENGGCRQSTCLRDLLAFGKGAQIPGSNSGLAGLYAVLVCGVSCLLLKVRDPGIVSG